MRIGRRSCPIWRPAIRFGEGAVSEADLPGDDDDDEATLEPERARSPAPRKPRGSNPSSATNLAAKPRADTGGKPLDVKDLQHLRERLSRQMLDEAITENTVRTYLRAFDCMIEFARSRSGRRPLASWRDECVAAIDAGQLEAPQSLPQFLKVAVRRARKLGD